ncbi:arabinofuranosyltransferase, partial [Mycobacterium avium]|uniref:arabinofuranosyltransferase n=1 Tax=Mycobacterium avium TaxID=1764 RepID=UPI001E62F325
VVTISAYSNRTMRHHSTSATATAAVTLAYGSPEPYSAMITVLLPPMLVLTWSGLRAGECRAGGMPETAERAAGGAPETAERETNFTVGAERETNFTLA